MINLLVGAVIGAVIGILVAVKNPTLAAMIQSLADEVKAKAKEKENQQ